MGYLSACVQHYAVEDKNEHRMMIGDEEFHRLMKEIGVMPKVLNEAMVSQLFANIQKEEAGSQDEGASQVCGRTISRVFEILSEIACSHTILLVDSHAQHVNAFVASTVTNVVICSHSACTMCDLVLGYSCE